jgi:hypothetical protein
MCTAAGAAILRSGKLGEARVDASARARVRETESKIGTGRERRRI